jgi:hypothetical protein
MDPDGRFVEADHRAHFTWRAIAVVTQHEDGTLPAFEPIDGGGHPRAAFAGEQPGFGVRLSSSVGGMGCERDATVETGSRRVVRRHDPSVAAHARLPAIEAAIDENAGEPDFERPRFAVRTDVAEHLDEGVLDGFVGLGGITEILESDAKCAALMCNDESFETLASLFHFAAFHELANFDGQTRVV